MEWELSKENFAPVRQGRSKAVLSDVHDAADSATKTANQAKRRELERDVREYAGDDPLEPWLRLVKWTQEQLVGGSKVQLQETIEACTRELSALGSKYHSDVRYLRLWIQYADCLADPSDVFFFLRQKQIGHEYALFYEAHATHYELKGNCTAADAVYQEGINRCAKPVDRLKQKYLAFQTRMAQRIQRKIQEEGLLLQSASAAAPPTRSSLSSLRQALPGGVGSGAGSSGRHHLPAPVPQIPGGVPALYAAPGARLPPQLPGQRAVAAGSGGSAAASLPSLLFGHKLAHNPPVVVDDEFRAPQRPLPTDAYLPGGFLALPQVGGGAKELMPHSLTHKENNEAPSIWTGAALPPPPGGGRPTAPLLGGGPPAAAGKLEICVDDEFLDETPVQPQPGRSQLNPMQARLDHAVQALPFAPGLGLPSLGALEHGSAGAVPAAAATDSVPQPREQGQQGMGWAPAAAGKAASVRGASKSGPTASLGFDASLLADAAGKEQSFEEARAAAWLLRQPRQPERQAACGGTAAVAAPVAAAAAALSSVCLGGGQAPPFTSAAAASAAGSTHTSVSSLQQQQQQQKPLSLPLVGASTSQPLMPFQSVPSVVAPAGRTVAGVQEGVAVSAQQSQRPSVSAQPMSAWQAGSQRPQDAPHHRGGPSVATGSAGQQQVAAAVHDVGGVAGSSAATLCKQPSQQQPLQQPQKQQPDPNVTISTRAAFDILNDMFSDSLAHGRGASSAGAAAAASASVAKPPPPPAAAQQQRPQQAPLALQPDAAAGVVTSRAAAPSARPATGAPSAGFAASAAPSGLPSSWSESDRMVGAPVGPRHPQPSEPTVTISTRAAFDALNDMFCDQLPHEEGLRSKGSGLGRLASMPISASDVCRLANKAGGVGSKPAPSQQPLATPMPPPGSSFSLHEDTEFVVPGLLLATARSSTAAAAPGGFDGDGDTEMLDIGGGGGGGLMVYEDTCLLPGGGGVTGLGAGYPSAALVQEDTEFVTRDILMGGGQGAAWGGTGAWTPAQQGPGRA